ncbi:Two pore calcium channel protein 1 [Schistosoma japonicum]|nr:Two pore calcium channel protein 1 [Schistosoma japonicum]
MDRTDKRLSSRVRDFVLGTTLIRDACATRLDIPFKQDIFSVQWYEHYYNKPYVLLYYLLTVINLSTVLIEYPGNIRINGKSLPYYIPLVINLLCECYFYYRWFIIYIALKSNISFITTIVILIIMTIDAILYMIFHELHFSTSVRWSRALRPVLLLTFPENRRLRAAFYNLRRTLIDVLPVFGLFGACLIFISIVSVTLLGNTKLTYPNGNKYLQDFSDVLWEFYVLTTTANSPDVILPAYEYNPYYIFIYLFICTTCNWLFMGILTASVYNSYKSHLGEFVVKTVAKRKEKLDEAFNLISTRTSDGKLGVSQHTFLHLMHIVTPKRSEDSMKVIFYLLDKNKSGYLSKHEFERLSEYMQAKFEEIELSYAFFNTYISKFHYIYTSSKFQQFIHYMNHNITKLIFTSFIILNAISVVIFRMYSELLEIIEWLFTILFIIELFINYLICGGVKFFNDGWNIFDCIIVFSALIGQIIQFIFYSINIYLSHEIIEIFLLLRLLRLLKVFSVIKQFRIVINCILTILPSLTAYTTILLILFYIFSCIAMELFGYIYQPPLHYNYTLNTTCHNQYLLGSEFVQWHYCTFNFNSPFDSFLLLLIIIVGNNWHIFTDGYVMVTTRWSRLFFIIIHWICVLLVLNVVLAFIIEAFLIEYDSQQKMNAENELKKRGLENFRKPGFIMSKELLDNAGLNDHSKNKVFYLKTDNASIEILMFRMFEKEIEELVDDLTNKHITTKLRAHDPFSHL